MLLCVRQHKTPPDLRSITQPLTHRNTNQRFFVKRVRSGVETLLANQEVSQETRGRLQSHGITGIQNAHYNAFGYALEKRQALQILLDTLNGKIEVRKYNSPEKANLAQNAGLV